MARYIVTYDLRQPGRNYDDLYARIKSYPKWARLTESSWGIVSSETSSDIRDHLAEAVDENDKLLVGVLGRPSAWYGLSKSISDWIKANA